MTILTPLKSVSSAKSPFWGSFLTHFSSILLQPPQICESSGAKPLKSGISYPKSFRFLTLFLPFIPLYPWNPFSPSFRGLNLPLKTLKLPLKTLKMTHFRPQNEQKNTFFSLFSKNAIFAIFENFPIFLVTRKPRFVNPWIYPPRSWSIRPPIPPLWTEIPDLPQISFCYPKCPFFKTWKSQNR